MKNGFKKIKNSTNKFQLNDQHRKEKLKKANQMNNQYKKC